MTRRGKATKASAPAKGADDVAPAKARAEKKPSGLITGAHVVRAFRQHRHRAAVLSHLATEVQGHFSAMSGPPMYLVKLSDGTVGPADDSVVVGLALEFAQRAEEERERARALLRQAVGELRADELQGDQPSDGDDLTDETELCDEWDPKKRHVLA